MDDLSALLNKAHQLFKAGDTAAAAPLYSRALELDAGSLAALTSLGTIYLAKGNYQESAHLFKQALALDPDSVIANSNLGFILLQSGKYFEAAKHLTAALKKEPRQAYLWNDLGDAFRKAGQLARAAEYYQKAVTINPTYIDGYMNLALVSKQLNKYLDAAGYFTKVISLNPNPDVLPKIFMELFEIFYYKVPDVKKALHYAKMSLSAKPDVVEMQVMLSTSLLTQGNIAEGIAVLTTVKNDFYFWTDIPQWQGEIFTGKRLIISNAKFVFGGHGDFMQFARYVPLVKERGGHVAICAKKELLRVLESLNGADEILLFEDVRSEDFDLQIPLIILPLIFETSLKTIPAEIPYLSVEPKLTASWKNLIDSDEPNTQTLKVGLVWACESSRPAASTRTCDFEFFAPLKDIPGITYYTLQIGAYEKEYLCHPDFKVVDLTEHIEDFADTAALINNLDLVITIDTAVAHLAGAIGKPVWLMLNLRPDWRWFKDRNDSPWYPTMLIFRAKKTDGWSEVFEEVCQQLRLVHQNRELLLNKC